MTGTLSQSDLDKKKAKKKESDRRYYQENKDKILEKTKKYYHTLPPDKLKRRLKGVRQTHLKSKYGITEEQYNALGEAQKQECAICKEPAEKLHVDHDHFTNVVRGLLCPHCNWLLGYARDDRTILANAISYLQNPPAPAVLQ